ncbi:MAG TPA: hypothetical protein VIV14_02150, partial [Gammaproteobacteria bacterium]
VRIVGLLVAIVAALVTIPQAALLIAILGLVYGWFIAAEDRILVLIGTVALVTVAASLNSIPAIGIYLTAILTNLGALYSAAVVTVLAVTIYEKVTG